MRPKPMWIEPFHVNHNFGVVVYTRMLRRRRPGTYALMYCGMLRFPGTLTSCIAPTLSGHMRLFIIVY